MQIQQEFILLFKFKICFWETLCPVTVGSTMPNLPLVHMGDEPSETMKKDSFGTLSVLLQMMCLVLSFFLFFFRMQSIKNILILSNQRDINFKRNTLV